MSYILIKVYVSVKITSSPSTKRLYQSENVPLGIPTCLKRKTRRSTSVFVSIAPPIVHKKKNTELLLGRNPSQADPNPRSESKMYCTTRSKANRQNLFFQDTKATNKKTNNNRYKIRACRRKPVV